ncbi:enoyl-CoA hydratase-related protein [Desulfurella sp.]|uniref:enoyl-CoA hydratase-related protein n=1 Tax=Desulfurella sp. TaxID=1962857 RepID=UPI0025C4D35E|nr:enoyl-CoA hydratase-related protein [Desulfurella sp.]
MNLNFFDIQRLGNIELISFLNEKHASAQTWEFFTELVDLVNEIENDDNILVAIFTGKGNHFSAGLDFNDFLNRFGNLIGNNSENLYEIIKMMQKGMNLLFDGNKIYIAAINGYCIGSGLDFISACDFRFCSSNAIFCLKETQLGIIADLGSLQRLPYIIGFSNTKKLALTSENIDSEIALKIGLVSEVFENKEKMISEVIKFSQNIAKNPKNAIFGSKKYINNLLKSTIFTQLDDIARFNANNLNLKNIKNNLPSIFKKES